MPERGGDAGRDREDRVANGRARFLEQSRKRAKYGAEAQRAEDDRNGAGETARGARGRTGAGRARAGRGRRIDGHGDHGGTRGTRGKAHRSRDEQPPRRSAGPKERDRQHPSRRRRHGVVRLGVHALPHDCAILRAARIQSGRAGLPTRGRSGAEKRGHRSVGADGLRLSQVRGGRTPARAHIAV